MAALGLSPANGSRAAQSTAGEGGMESAWQLGYVMRQRCTVLSIGVVRLDRKQDSGDVLRMNRASQSAGVGLRNWTSRRARITQSLAIVGRCTKHMAAARIASG